jgi:glutaredoxin
LEGAASAPDPQATPGAQAPATGPLARAGTSSGAYKPIGATGPLARAGTSSGTYKPISERRSSTPPPKEPIVSILPGDDGDEVVVRVPRGLVIGGAAIVIALGAFAWSRITPDLSFFNNLFPAPAVLSSAQATVQEPPAPARAIEQAEPVKTEAIPTSVEVREVAPSAATGEDPAALARRLQNQIEEKKERLAHARRNVSVTMYSTTWCKVCKDARRYFTEAGITYEDHDVDSDRDADRRLRAVNPRHTVPTFDIDGAILTGFSPGAFESMLTSAAARRAARE